MTSGASKERWIVGLLAVAGLIGLLRFWELGTWSLWLDEAYTLTDIHHREGIPNPLGYVLLGLFYDIWGERPDELLLRLPSAIIGWLCIPFTYWAVKPIVGRRAAAVAALIVAASSWHLYWSQNARFYTLAQLLGLLGGGLLLRGLIGSRSSRVGIGLLLGVFAAAVHPSAAMLVLAFLIAPWLARPFGMFPDAYARPRPWRVLSLIGFASVFVGLIWVIEVLLTWEQRHGEGTPVHFVLSTGFLVGPLVGAAAVLGIWVALRRRDHRGILAVLIAGISLGAAFGASLFVRVSAQYVFVSLPWIAACAAIPVAEWARKRPAPERTRVLGPLLLLALILLPSLGDSALYFGVREGDRPQWRAAYRYVFEHHRPYDLILGMEAPVGEYYFDPLATDLRKWRKVTWLDRHRVDLVGDWSRYPRRTWFIVNQEQMEDWPREDRESMRRVLSEQCRLLTSYEIPLTPRDLDVQVYLRE